MWKSCIIRPTAAARRLHAAVEFPSIHVNAREGRGGAPGADPPSRHDATISRLFPSLFLPFGFPSFLSLNKIFLDSNLLLPTD